MASSPTSKRMESLTDALRQSRSHMKRCFARYMEKGRQVMKLHHLMDEMEKVIDNKSERDQLLGSDFGRILRYTQVDFRYLYLFFPDSRKGRPPGPG